jgi:hypothetical protein
MLKRTPLISIVAIILTIFNLFYFAGCSSGQAILSTLTDTAATGTAEYIYVGGNVNNPGSFKNINELLKVGGIGQDTFDNIRELITVYD